MAEWRSERSTVDLRSGLQAVNVLHKSYGLIYLGRCGPPSSIWPVS